MATAWAPPPRSDAALSVYAAAESDREINPDRYRLGDEAVDLVIDRATSRCGVAALGDPMGWRPGVEHYLSSAALDGRLNALGARTVQDTVTAKLRARAATGEYLAARPDVAERALTPPIVIIGGWRTGTTFLFRLLAGDPRLRAPLPAELYAPWRMAGLEPDERERRIDASGAGHDLLHTLNPTMAAVHDSGARLPEECVLGMGMSLRNWAFSSTTRLDSYAEWLAGEDFHDEYIAHRQMLQILDDGSDRRWLLKAPAHTAELRALAATYPGAVVVHLHRDIVETVASGASLFATYRSTYSDDVDGADVGRFQIEQTELWLRRALAFRDSDEAKTITYLDVAYADLVADTSSTVRRVYEAADIEPPDLEAMIDAHHAAQPRSGKGRHRYEPEQFGIVPGELRERMAFYPFP
ncbi:sulfotransferase [Gordonia sp. SID5947]|uniref:sulfotransferase family protein n=1 Tax=Gordonia sp. SID5947 TaxID=2690315 RepID=UPI001368DA5B|nr:sulfotransferase [Gordonia sp. SID5947]MYR08170.1 sulfotransferase [Gordonia sp. SID5947]